MDINGFSLDQEYFGFNQYKSSPKSNLDFMYFTKVEETEEYKKALRLHNDLVDNIKESGLPQGEIDRQLKEEEKRFNKEVLKIKGDRALQGAGQAASVFGSLFEKTTAALGITKQTGTGQAPVNVSYGDKSQGNGGTNKKIYWIVGGIAVLAIAGIVIYKMRK
jgi:hypothetical protein